MRAGSRSQAVALAAADPDLVEELVRRNLGLVRPDEVILPADGTPAIRPASVRRP